MGWLTGWNNRFSIKLDRTDVDDNLSNFPILIVLSGSTGINSQDLTPIFDELGENNLKFAITTDDGVAQCYNEVEFWSGAIEQAWIWTKVPVVTSSAAAEDTKLYFYYSKNQSDNSTYVGAIDSVAGRNVWDSNFVLVCHMQDSTTSLVLDSTSTGQDGTKTGANNPIVSNAIVSKGQSFNGTTSGINFSSGAAINNLLTLTYEAWIAPITWGEGTWGRIIHTENYGPFFYLSQKDATEGTGSLTFCKIFTGTDGYWHTANNTITTGSPQGALPAWQYVAVTYNTGSNANDPIFYITGSVSPTQLLNRPTNIANSDNYCELWVGNMASNARTFSGSIDEVRVSNVIRSAAWIKATYETGRNNFLSFGAIEKPAVLHRMLFGVGL